MATNNLSRLPVALRAAGLIIVGTVLAGPLLAASATMAGGDTVSTPAQWHPQKLDFTYAGFTSYYTCEGMESKVRTILLTLGARNDAKVQAIGCDRASNKPNKVLWVTAQFSTLAPAADGAAPADTVQAAWSKVQIAPNRPTEMGMGECELVEQLRPIIEKDFTLRNTEYRTSCVPKQVSVADYNFKSDVLRLAAPMAN